MLNSRLFRLQQNQSRHFSTVLIRTNWYTICCKYFGCKSLSHVKISNSLKIIRDELFLNCNNLTSIEIPNSVKEIKTGAFSGCSGLTSVTIPNSVTSIDAGAFSGCSGLISIKVESGNTKYDSRDRCNAIIETASNS